MYKLLIVEDEIWEREGLIDFIDWHQLNIEIVGTASNGIQGLKMAKMYLPDIIITDIRMPIMDGLELSRRVKLFLPQCKIIIITGYDDFEYARDAIYVGVYNYLLKPVQKNQLLGTINRVIKDILQEKKQVEHIRILKQQVTERMYADRERFLLNLIRSDQEYKQNWNKAQDLGITFFEQDVVAIIIRVDAFYFCHNNEYNDKQFRYREICRTIQRRIGNQGIVAMDDSVNYDIILCIPTNSKDRNYINDITYRIMEEDYKLKPSQYAVGVGSVCKTLDGITQSYLQAKTALDTLFFNEEASILFFDDIVSREEMDEQEITKFFADAFSYSKKILDTVISSNKQNVIEITEELFDFIYKCPVDKSLVCNYFTSLIKEISILMPSIDEYLNLVNYVGEDTILNSFIKLNSLKKWILDLLVYTNNFFIQKRKNKEKDVVDKVIEIMNNEYSRNIGIDIIAQRLDVSPNYLSSLFKQHTGKRFTKSLTDIRMKKAKEFLISGNQSIMDIAKTVGFTNASYFCTVFKKVYGITPREYREQFSYSKEK